MATNEIEDDFIHCDKLAIFTCETRIDGYQLRNYMIDHWKIITKSLKDDSVILFLYGTHGGADGKLGNQASEEEKLDIKRQVSFFE